MRTFVSLLILAAASALSACGGDGTTASEQGHLRLVNATSGATALELLAGGNAVASNVGAFSASSYADLKPDTYAMDVRQAGNASTLVTANATVSRKRSQTAVAYTSGGAMTLTFLDDEEGAPGTGKAKFRVFNTAAADAGKVDVYLVTTECSKLDATAAAPTAADVGGLQSTYSELVSSATAYHLCVTGSGDRTDLRLEIPSFVLSEKRVVTVILGRGVGGYLLNGIVLDQQGAATQALNGLARVRVAASVASSVAVGVDVNGTPISAGLPSPNVGPYVLVPTGAVSLKVNDVAVTLTNPGAAGAGADLTVLLTGSTPTATLLADDNTASSSSARPVKLRLVNGLNGIPGTATLTLNNVLVGTGAAPGSASGYAQVSSSAGLARLEARVGTVQLYLKDSATLEAGRVYTLFLLGDASAAPNTGILIPDR